MSEDPAARLRIPPHSTEAEQAVLGCLMLDNSVAESVAALLRPADFYSHQHRVVYQACLGLILGGRTADVLTVHDASGQDLAYLNGMANSVMSASSALAYARLVREHATRRQLAVLGDELASAAMQQGPAAKSPQEIVDHFAAALLGVQGVAAAREPHRIGDLVGPWIDALQERAAGKIDAIQTGLRDVDRLLSGGLRRGELVVIGARPSMGKSALSLTLARHMAGVGTVLVCSMEDSEAMLIARQVAAAGRVNLADIRRPDRAPDSMWSGVAEGVEQLQHIGLYLDDQPALSLSDVRRKAAQVKRRAGDLHVVVVDYLQLMVGDGDNRHQVLGAIAAGLKTMAKEYGCAVILLSQLNREADKLSGPPRLDHLRESGGIEEAADIVGLLWREHRSKPTPANKHDAQIEFAKHKNGPTDTVRLFFDGATQRFADMEHGSTEP